MQHVFIIGSKGIPAHYGGFETFVDKLTEYNKSKSIKYHVACAVDKLSVEPEFEYNNAHCFQIKWRPFKAAKAVFYDLDALSWSIKYVEEHQIRRPVFYVLACRIGPFIGHYIRKIHALGGKLFVNPDGHEWKRAKWSAPIRKYWKISEAGMVKSADLLVCDSKTIEKYIHDEYASLKPKSIFIAYGADEKKSDLADDAPDFIKWLQNNDLYQKEYYLVVGRFVPENNYETMISEFMRSHTKKKFVLITNVESGFLDQLQKRTGFKQDPRIRFTTTVYDKELLKKIRENAYAYLHGHEVGGTNPSLLEALSSTQINMLLDVEFNREVAENSAVYWSKERGSLASLIDAADSFDQDIISGMDESSHDRIAQKYTWNQVSDDYELLFVNNSIRTQ